MPLPVKSLPVVQNWDCHGCGDCCKTYHVRVSDVEKARIESQNWATDLPGVEPIVWDRHEKGFRLNHTLMGPASSSMPTTAAEFTRSSVWRPSRSPAASTRSRWSRRATTAASASASLSLRQCQQGASRSRTRRTNWRSMPHSSRRTSAPRRRTRRHSRLVNPSPGPT